jgi:hypothetical protein
MAKIGYKLKLIDEEMFNTIDQNAEIIVRDPARVGEELGKLYKNIADNPGAFIKDLQS